MPVPTGAGAPRRRADDEYSSDDSSSRNRTKLARNVGFDRQQRDAENAAKVAEQLEKINAQRTMLQPVFAENPEVEAFLKTHHEIEPRAVAQLRAMPHEQARMVITGPLDRARNKTAVILARIKNLSMGMHPTGVGVPGLGMTPGAPGAQPQPAVASAPAAAAADTSMDELMAKLNADLAKEQPKSEPQRKAGRATAEELSRQFSGRISAEPVPAGAAATGRPGGERGEEAGRGGRPVDDIPIELPPEPASKGASSSRTPAEKPAVPSKPKGVMPRPFSSNPFHRRKASPPKKKEVEPLEPVPVPVAVEAAVSRPILGDYAPAAPAELPNGMPQVLPEAMDVWAQQMAGSWEQQAARQSADPEADARFRMMAAKFRADVQQWKEASGEDSSWHGTDSRELPPNPDGPVKPGPVSPGLVQGKGAGKDAGGSPPWSGMKGSPWSKGKDKGDKGCSKGEALAQANSKAAAMAPVAEEMKGKGKGKGKGGEDWFAGPAADAPAAEPEASAAEAPAADAHAAEPEAESKPKPADPKPSEVPSFASILEKMRALKNKPTSAAKESQSQAGASGEAGAKAAIEMPSFSAETPTLDSILEKMRAVKEKNKPAAVPEASSPPPSEAAAPLEPAAAAAAAPPGLSAAPAGLTGTLAALARQMGVAAGEAEAPGPEAAAPAAAVPAAAAALAAGGEGDGGSAELWAQAEQARAAAAATGAAALPQGAELGAMDPAAEAAMAAAAATAGAADPNADDAEAARNKQYEAYWIQCQQAAHQALFASSGSLFGGGGSTPWDQAGDDWSGGGYSSTRTLMHDPMSRPGDWRCPQCGDHQFSRNMACRQCGAKRPGEMDLLLQDPNVPANLQALISAHHKQLQQEHEEKEALREARGKGRGKKGYKGKD